MKHREGKRDLGVVYHARPINGLGCLDDYYLPKLECKLWIGAAYFLFRIFVHPRKEMLVSMGKVGRPIKENAMRKQYKIRMDDEFATRVNELSKKTGKSKAELFREGIDTLFKKH